MRAHDRSGCDDGRRARPRCCCTRPRRRRCRPAAAYAETEAHIGERRERGLFADMKFTMARPDVSCHPELLLDGRAKTVVSAALCYWVDGPEPGAGRRAASPVRVARPLRAPPREARRARAAARRELPRPRRREPARRPRGSAARRGRLLRQEHDADHARARLLGRARNARHGRRDRGDASRSSSTAAAARSASMRARRARSTSRACSTRIAASRTGRRRLRRCPRTYRERARRDRVRLRHLPGRLPLEPGDREAARDGAAPRRRRAERLARRLARPAPAAISSPSSTGSTCRGTTRAGCGATRSTRSATRDDDRLPGAPGAVPDERRPDPRRRGRLGGDADRGARA